MCVPGSKFIVGDGDYNRVVEIVEVVPPEIETSNDTWYKVRDYDDNTEMIIPQCYIKQYGVRYECN